MKKSYFIVLAVLVGVSFFYSCSSGDEKKGAKRGLLYSKKKKELKKDQVRIPPLDSLVVLPKPTMYVIDRVNGEKKRNIKIVGENIIIEGWAVDEKANTIPAGIYITIGEQVFTAVSGGVKPSVAITYDNKNYLKCGFSRVIPTKKIPKGKHPLEIHVIAADMKSVYSPRANRRMDLIIE